MNNTHRYGFRWSTAGNVGRPCPTPVERSLATGYAAEADSAGGTDYVDIRVGDPVGHLSSGYVELANGGDLVWGIVVGIKQYWDGTKLVTGNRIPHATAYGTVLSRSSILYVVPVAAGRWEIDANENTTATTEAAYHALIGLNYPHTCPGLRVSSQVKPEADPHLDISEGATTAGLEWRLEAISKTFDNRDLSGEYVKLIVSANATQLAGSAATPVVGV